MPQSIAKTRCFENWYVRTKRECYIYGVEENVFMDRQCGYNLVKMWSKEVLMDRSRCIGR